MILIIYTYIWWYMQIWSNMGRIILNHSSWGDVYNINRLPPRWSWKWSFTEDLRISLRLWPAYAHLWHSKHVLLHLHVLPCGPGAGCCPATFYDLVGSSVRSLDQKPSNSDLVGLVFWYILVLPMARFYVCSGWWDTQGSSLEKESQFRLQPESLRKANWGCTFVSAIGIF